MSAVSQAPGERCGSRRARLWQLPAPLHDGVLAIGLPVRELRALLDALFGARSSLRGAELHLAAVAQCATRNRVSEALQRALDLRFAAALRSIGPACSTDALAQRWSAALATGEFAGVLWATLTHARCDAALVERVAADLQLLRYQVAASLHGELAACEALRAQNQALRQALDRLCQRQQHVQAERCRERNAGDALVRELRGRLLVLEHAAARQQASMSAQRTETATPPVPRVRGEAPSRWRPRTLLSAGARSSEGGPGQAAALAGEALPNRGAVAQACVAPALNAPDAAQRTLLTRRVLCVGGRQAQVLAMRRLVEDCGGRFSHHDGGIEHNAHRLDAQLLAAEVVVCQAGCLNHNAYATVKAHCKRTGKPCVYVQRPGTAGLWRALAGSAPAVSAAAAIAPQES